MPTRFRRGDASGPGRTDRRVDQQLEIAALAGIVEGLYQALFPDLSDRALRNIEAISNIVGLALAIILSVKTYKRLAKTQGDRCEDIRDK